MQVAKLVSGLFDRYSLLRNNNMATNLQRFSYGRRRFVACDCRTQGRIKGRGGQREQLPRAPRCKGTPRDEIYLFQIKYLFEKFRDSEAIQEYNSILYSYMSR